LSEFFVALLMLSLIPFVLIPMCSILRRGTKRCIKTYRKNRVNGAAHRAQGVPTFGSPVEPRSKYDFTTAGNDSQNNVP